jgi:hypothetical protein
MVLVSRIRQAIIAELFLNEVWHKPRPSDAGSLEWWSKMRGTGILDSLAGVAFVKKVSFLLDISVLYFTMAISWLTFHGKKYSLRSLLLRTAI